MPSVSKFKSDDGILSMYLVPKKMYNILLKIAHEDEENKNELIAMNQSQTNNNNYIENAITFKKQQDDQKKKRLAAENKFDFSPNALSRTVSTFRPLQRGDTFPTNVTRENTLSDDQTPIQQETTRRTLTFSGSTPKRGSYSFKNSPIMDAINYPNKLGRLVCPLCNKSYQNKRRLASHLMDVHMKDLAVRDKRKLHEISLEKKKTTPSKFKSASKRNTKTPSPSEPASKRKATPSPSEGEDTPFSTPPAEEAKSPGSSRPSRKNIYPSKYPKI